MHSLTNTPSWNATRGVVVGAIDWPRGWRYLAALAVVILVALLRWQLPLASVPFLLFMPGMFAVGFLFGKGPGIFATLLSAAVVGCVFMAPEGKHWLSADEALGIFLYLLICLGLVHLCALSRRTLAQRGEDLAATRAANLALLDSRMALEANEAFLRSVLESSPDCIKILDLEARVTFMSEQGMRAMHVGDFNTIEHCPWPEFWQGEGNRAALAAVEDAKAGRTGHFQGYCETMAGVPKWWDVVVTPILDTDGTPEKILAISRDITVSQSADQERARLALLIEQSNDFIGIADVHGKVTFLNDAAMRLVGLTPTEMINTHVADYFTPGDRETITNVVIPAVRRNRPLGRRASLPPLPDPRRHTRAVHHLPRTRCAQRPARLRDGHQGRDHAEARRSPATTAQPRIGSPAEEHAGHGAGHRQPDAEARRKP